VVRLTRTARKTAEDVALRKIAFATTAEDVTPLESALTTTAAPPLTSKFVSGLEQHQRAALDPARKAFVAAGGVLDEFGDVFLARFLAAHGWQVEPAVAQLARTAAWRSSSGANEKRAQLLSGSSAWATAHPKMSVLLDCAIALPLQGRCRNGDLIKLIDLGAIDSQKYATELEDDETLEMTTWTLELEMLAADRASCEAGTLVQVTAILNTAGFGRRQFSWTLIRRLKAIAPLPELYYPSLQRATVVLNAPKIVVYGWSLVRMVMSKEEQAKVAILGDSVASHAALSAKVESAVLPTGLGGTKEAMTEAERQALGFVGPAMLERLARHGRGTCLEQYLA